MHNFLNTVGSVCSIIGVMPLFKKLFQKCKHKKEKSEPTVPAASSLIVTIEIPVSIIVIYVYFKW